jgi:glycosyltransferase involved in cell wall biosynthesis
MESRLHAFGTLEGQRLVDAYHAADVFVFASQSETQGIVLTEAMAAGLPVVAVDAPGVREVVRDGYNGCLLPQENKDRFVDALLWIARMDDTARAQLSKHAEETARSFSIERCADKALSIYADAAAAGSGYRESESNLWEEAKRRIRVEWELLATKTKATAESVGPLQK